MNKTTKDIIKGLKEVKESKISKINFEELEKEVFKKWEWYDNCYWFIRHGIWQYIYDIPLNIKSFFQRGIKGWANSDTWGFDSYLSKVIYNGLLHLKKHKHGYPITITPKIVKDPNKDIDYDENEQNWNDIMDKMIYAFKLANDLGTGEREFYLSKLSKEKQLKFKCLTKEEDKKMKMGMGLFIKHYYNLWD